MTKEDSISYLIFLQNEINNKMTPSWRIKKFHWELALLDECVEAIDSLGWKWWRKDSPDWKNYLVELTDMLFYSLTISMYYLGDRSTDVILKAAINLYENEEDKSKNRESKLSTKLDTLLEVVQEVSKLSSKNIEEDNFRVRINNIIQKIIFLINLEIDSLSRLGIYKKVEFALYKTIIKLYLSKYELNVFRQNNGYKEGTYIKIWHNEADSSALLTSVLKLDSEDVVILQESIKNTIARLYPNNYDVCNPAS